ncbi:MAG: YtxH domain-containing protein [Ignavibacteriales bacterium]
MSRGSEQMTGFFTGIIVGGLVGGIAALLYTPVSGKKLRKQIAKKTDNIMDDMNEYYETVEEIIKDGRKKAESLIDDAKKIIAS